MNEQTVVRMQFGSHLYGTNTPLSDFDFKGVHIPSAEDILLQRVKGEISVNERSKKEGEKNEPGDVDDKSYSLQKFLGLVAEGQTVALDMLFAPDNMLIQSSPCWDYIRANRHKLLTKKSAAFLGYCRQQANKYGIKGSRVAAAKLASEFFKREYDWLPNGKVGDLIWSDVHKIVDGEHNKLLQHPVGSTGELGWFFECCGRKVAFNSKLRQAAEIFTAIYNNYGDRAKKAESNEGVDWKALSHAVRVGSEAVELLMTGNITFPLPYADYIRGIKKGLYDYESVSTEIEGLMEDVERLSKTSSLPDEVDHKFIEDLILQMHKGVIYNEFTFGD